MYVYHVGACCVCVLVSAVGLWLFFMSDLNCSGSTAIEDSTGQNRSARR